MCGQSKGVFFSAVDAADFVELDEFAFDHFLREVDEDIEDSEVALFQSHLEGQHVQPVAGENAAVIAPARICRGTAASRVRRVDHIVVNEGGAVKQLHYCG